MPVTIIGKLNKPAREFQAGNSTGFGFMVGEQFYNRETKTKEWTNYECAVFSNKDGAINYMRDSLVEGAIVCVSAEKQNIKQFEGNNGLVLSINLNNCTLVRVFPPENAAPPQQGYGQYQGNQPPQQIAPQQHQQQPQQREQGQEHFQRSRPPQQQEGAQQNQPEYTSDSIPF